MHIKNISQLVLFALLSTSCFKSNLQMMNGDGKTTEMKDIKYDKEELNAESEKIYAEFVNLVDDPRVSIDSVMEFLKNNKRHLDGLNNK